MASGRGRLDRGFALGFASVPLLLRAVALDLVKLEGLKNLIRREQQRYSAIAGWLWRVRRILSRHLRKLEAAPKASRAPINSAAAVMMPIARTTI